MPGAAKSCGCGTCAECRAATPANPAAQRGALDSTTAPAIARQARQAPGRALDAATRRSMELRFGHDFGKVRIHTDADAGEAAQSMASHAYTVGDDIFFAPDTFEPQSRAGLDLLAHELAHVVQQEGSDSLGGDEHVATAASRHEKAADDSAREVAAGRHVPLLDKTTPSVQRRLLVDAGASLLDASGTPLRRLVDADPAADLSAFERLDMMDRVIASLCPSFTVDKGAAAGPVGSGEVVAKGAASLAPGPLAATGNATGCCCLNILVNGSDTWTIHVSQLVSPSTRFTGAGGEIVLPSERTPLESGSYTARGVPAFQGLVPTAGHELCGRAALHQINAHPSTGNRLTSDEHDPTVRIENPIASEQSVPGGNLRGLAGSGPHRGEWLERLTVSGFGGEVSDAALLPPADQAKLQFAASYIRQNDTFADVIGHSDHSEAAGANSSPGVSEKRARSVRQMLGTTGRVPDKLTPLLTKTAVDRFTRVAGVLDTDPVDTAAAPASPAERRVEVLMPVFSAGAQVAPKGTSSRVDKVPEPPGAQAARSGPDACEQTLVGAAYPTAPKAAKATRP
jgi:flagellar motor protein MotB